MQKCIGYKNSNWSMLIISKYPLNQTNLSTHETVYLSRVFWTFIPHYFSFFSKKEDNYRIYYYMKSGFSRSINMSDLIITPCCDTCALQQHEDLLFLFNRYCKITDKMLFTEPLSINYENWRRMRKIKWCSEQMELQIIVKCYTLAGDKKRR